MTIKQSSKKVIQGVEFSIVCNFLLEIIVKVSFEEIVIWLNKFRQDWIEKNNLVGKFFYLIPFVINKEYWNLIDSNMIYLKDATENCFIVFTEEKCDHIQFNFSNDGSSISGIKNRENGLWTITLELTDSLKETMYYELCNKYFNISNDYN